MQVALDLAESELNTFDGSEAGELQTVPGSINNKEVAMLIQQFRQQKQRVLREGIDRLRQGLQQFN